MTINVTGLQEVARWKPFSNVREGTSFVGSFQGHFGIYYRTGELEVVRIREQGWLHVLHLDKSACSSTQACSTTRRSTCR